jgi:hypothetical protein
MSTTISLPAAIMSAGTAIAVGLWAKALYHTGNSATDCDNYGNTIHEKKEMLKAAKCWWWGLSALAAGFGLATAADSVPGSHTVSVPVPKSTVSAKSR